jgi:hypothetical protein
MIKNNTFTEVKPYGELYKSRFKNSFTDLCNLELNANIDMIFYDKKSLVGILTESDNELEKKWRSRILIENTPRGNVIMYYDAYKFGFAYHSDQYIPYDILNKVAMKYVITYQCRDFFIDELERPDGTPPKLSFLFEDDKKPVSSNDISTRVNTQNTHFAKFKNYNTVSSKVEINKETKSAQPIKDKIRNCFVHRGKIANFSFLQKPVVKKITFESEIGNGLFENSNVQKQVFSYREFKTNLENTN